MQACFFFGKINKRAVAAIAIFQIVIFVLCIACIFRHIAAKSQGSSAQEQKAECYISVQVRSGESLWEISERYYSSEYKDMNQYMKKIMRLNHMSGEDIHAGAYLIIPYYDSGQEALLEISGTASYYFCYKLNCNGAFSV